MNHSDSVRPATVELVKGAMAALGYTPPPPEKRRGPRLGTSFRRNKGLRSVALTMVGPRGLRWILDCAPVYSYVLHGIEAALAERGCDLLVRQASDWQSLERTIRASSPEGVILIGDEPEGEAKGTLAGLPTVWAMGSPQRLNSDYVQPDHSRCGILAAEWAIANGHTQCAFMGTGFGSPSRIMDYRYDSFAWRIRCAGGRATPLLDANIVVVSPQQNEVNETVIAGLVDQLIALKPRPTALLSGADIYTPSIYRLLHTHGIVPQVDMAVISINNERPYLTSLHPQPVIVDLQAESIGRRAVDQLFWRIEHPKEPHVRVMVEPLLL